MEDFIPKYKPEETAYKVPENYFSESKKALLVISKEEKLAGKLISLRQLSWISIGVAAAMVLGLFIWDEPDNNNTDLENLSAENIENYLWEETTFGSREELIIDELDLTDLPDDFLADEFEDLKSSDLNFDETLFYEYL